MSPLRNKVPTVIKFHLAILITILQWSSLFQLDFKGTTAKLLALNILNRTYVTVQILKVDGTLELVYLQYRTLNLSLSRVYFCYTSHSKTSHSPADDT